MRHVRGEGVVRQHRSIAQKLEHRYSSTGGRGDVSARARGWAQRGWFSLTRGP
jgi:hypothetical protein